mmetsp:Transcript_97047/g.152991  ORF Transcript_97047/g.152991 Transcript_97047/m.152991 type:complete len:656 (-) Transcript_97047:218-2185(-)
MPSNSWQAKAKDAEVKKEPKQAKGESKGGKGDVKSQKKERNKIPSEPQTPSSLLTQTALEPTYALTALLLIRSKSIDGTATTDQELIMRPYKMEDRPHPATEEEKVIGVRRVVPDALTEEPKAVEEKLEEVVDAPAMKAPPSPSPLKIDLNKELPSKIELFGSATPSSRMTLGSGSPTALGSATPNSAAAHDYFYSYLASMQIGFQQQQAAMQLQMNAVLGAGPTTVMLRNIPNRYSREMLVQRLNSGYAKQYDFVYLPIDFNSKCNVGYAFINFLAPAIAQQFMNEFHGQNCRQVLPGFSSQKIVEVTFARVQGKEQNLENLKDEKFMTKLSEQAEWQPLFWENGVEVPFETLLAESKYKKRSGARKTAAYSDMSPMVISPTSATGFGFGMPSYVDTPASSPPGIFSLADLVVVATNTDDTLLMLRGIPKSCDRTEFLEVLDKGFKGSYDFIFLPMDPKAEGYENRGFAFINFREASKGIAFRQKFNKAKSIEIFPSKGDVATDSTEAEGEKDKECEVEAAKLEALDSLLGRFRERAVDDTKLTPDWHPLLFHADGKPKEFPMKSAGLPVTPEKKKKGEKAKAKAKPKAKTKQMAYPAAKPMAYPASYPGLYGYPGYPPMGMGYTPPSPMAAQASAMAQAALMYAYAANPQGMM